jgi:hypothetical protein
MSLKPEFDAAMASVVGVVLSDYGFRKTNHVYVRREASNFLVIEPQTSVKSAATQILFTFNLKVISAKLASAVDGCDPPSATCPFPHWRQRLGGLLPQPGDRWWSFTGEMPHDVMTALTSFGLPAISVTATDDQLRDLWLTGRAPGLSELQRRIYLSTLLAMIGPKSKLPEYIALLDAVESSDPTRSRVDRHLQLIKSLSVDGGW